MPMNSAGRFESLRIIGTQSLRSAINATLASIFHLHASSSASTLKLAVRGTRAARNRFYAASNVSCHRKYSLFRRISIRIRILFVHVVSCRPHCRRNCDESFVPSLSQQFFLIRFHACFGKLAKTSMHGRRLNIS